MESIDSFCDQLSAAQPAPAGVAAAAVTARMGLGLLAKVAKIARADRIAEDAAQIAAQLAKIPEEDGAAVLAFIGAKGAERMNAARNAIAIPMRAAEGAAAGLGLCESAAPLVRGLPAADLRAAELLIAAALESILVCVGANLGALPPGDAEAFEIRRRCAELEARVRARM